MSRRRLRPGGIRLGVYVPVHRLVGLGGQEEAGLRVCGQRPHIVQTSVEHKIAICRDANCRMQVLVSSKSKMS